MTRYAVIMLSGDWLYLGESLPFAERVAGYYPGSHVERWTWPAEGDMLTVERL